MRDYVHIVDLTNGHMAALNYIFAHVAVSNWNLSVGFGYAMPEVVSTFEKASSRFVPFRVASHARSIAECWLDPSTALRELDWKAELGLNDGTHLAMVKYESGWGF